MLIIIFFITLSCSSTRACSVPVFKYALAYWEADPYEVMVFHRGNLSATEQTLVDKLEEVSWSGKIYANINLRMIDLERSPGEVMEKLWESQQASELPWMVVRYPRFSGISEDIWSGPLKSESIELILDSPVRQEIIRRIIDGEAAVWVLLESGDPRQDKAAADYLQEHLNKMSDTLKILPPVEYQFDESDLKVRFSMVSLSREGPKEQFLIQMLLIANGTSKLSQNP
jgi:hypothetical protein